MWKYNKKKSQTQSGFTLLESLVAITIFTFGVSASVGAVMHMLKSVPLVENKVIAAHLAQESIEIVRNIRDSNWIAGDVWDVNIPAGTGCVQYNQNSFDDLCVSYTLKSDGNYYSHDVVGGTDTIFSREITISYPVADEEMLVTSHVTCGQNCNVLLEDHLFNWK